MGTSIKNPQFRLIDRVVLPCIPKVYLIKISPVKILSSLILSLTLISLWSCSDGGKDPVSPGTDECTLDLDCNGVCGGSAVEDCAGTCDGSALLSNGDCTNISYTATIQPIFSTNCTGCHGGSGGLSLTSYSLLMENDVVNPGNSAESQLIKKLKGTAGTQMPKNQNPLDDATIELIETWIDEGALDN